MLDVGAHGRRRKRQGAHDLGGDVLFIEGPQTRLRQLAAQLRDVVLWDGV